jgi:hypothetical protein
VRQLQAGGGSFGSKWVFLTKTAKSQFVHRGAPNAGCLQEIDQFLDVDPIADIQEAVGPVEVSCASSLPGSLA